MYPSPSFRASDADREAVVAHLSAAAADGRLSLSEFDARTRHVYASRTWGELLRIVRDLPPLPPVAVPPRSAPEPAWPTVALVLGIISVLMMFCAPISVIAGLAAVVFGVLGLLPGTRGAGTRRGMALAGLICGASGMLLSIALTIFIAGID
ncbi:DUF1707 and DUF4190 domain-containing protein [Dactylosporangium sp. NBC_01737]|uniref:DUF1707 and DUF4190 domain-containing protein n=1 Tax=Dactylosporangium sp. NBC_01737 TaxID=2975959 RepID=UPI002E129FC9|nr:DUF1707 and DUF4190 domain-containing protein [Dactylosporangium sp. NBC_01737]